MSRFLIILLLMLAGGACVQPSRFRYPLRGYADLPASARMELDSARAVSDSVHRCPPRADTLWAADRRRPVPRAWLSAALTGGCGHASLPDPVRRRLRDDPASPRFYEAVVRGAFPATEDERARALQQLSWSAERRYLALFLHEARNGAPGLHERGDYNAAYVATLALAPYLHESPTARRVVLRAATDSAALARRAGVLALAAANTPWSRRALRGISREGIDEHTLGIVERALAHRPCRPGTIYVEWFGIEGQDYSKCEPAPDFR
jgi:hypothetical protein